MLFWRGWVPLLGAGFDKAAYNLLGKLVQARVSEARFKRSSHAQSDKSVHETPNGNANEFFSVGYVLDSDCRDFVEENICDWSGIRASFRSFWLSAQTSKQTFSVDARKPALSALQSSSVAKCCAPARMSASGELRRSVESLRERQLWAVRVRQIDADLADAAPHPRSVVSPICRMLRSARMSASDASDASCERWSYPFFTNCK